MKYELRNAIDSIKENGSFVLKNQLSLNTCKKLLILTKQLHSLKKICLKTKVVQ